MTKSIWWRLGITAVLLLMMVACNGRFPSATPDQIFYLGWQEGEPINQLYTINPTGGTATRLTEMPYGILDYTLSPDGRRLAYSATNADGRSDIWSINSDGSQQKRLWACADALCSQPIWAADGRRLIVERREFLTPDAPPAAPQLWWLDSQTGETLLVFADTSQTGYGAQLSPDNEWLSYLVPEAKEIRVTRLTTGESITTPSQTGEVPVWQPDGQALLLSDMWIQGESFSQHLLSLDLASAELTNISDPEMVTNDGSPVFSPNGEWLAFGRKQPQAPMGRQLWLMHPDGTDARALMSDADRHINKPSWSPDGEQMVVQALLWAEPNAEPGLWLVDVNTGAMQELVSPGMAPTWGRVAK